MLPHRYINGAFKGFILLLSAHFVSCSSEQKTKETYTELDRLSWLLGDWKATNEDGFSIEHWEKVNDSTFLGDSKWIVDEDTSVEEVLQLIQRNGVISYIPTVPDQNDGEPVSFQLVSHENALCVFENATHEFPQRISYTQIGQDSLVAEISGTFKEEFRSIAFGMKRFN